MAEPFTSQYIVTERTGETTNMRYILCIILTSVTFGATPTCAPVSFSAITVQGATFQEAVVNGVDNVGSNSARFQWKSDTNTNTVNANAAVYVTNAQWVANGNAFCSAGTVPGCSGGISPAGLTMPAAPRSITGVNTVQGANLQNLVGGTLYHVAGLSSSDNGTTWCPTAPTVTTFTTLAAPVTIPLPTAPAQFNPAVPAITGTTYTIGSGPCVASGTPGTGGYISAAQACINTWAAAHTTVTGLNDAIVGAGGTPNPVYPATPLNFPLPPNSHPVTCSSVTSICTLVSGTMAGFGLANGQLIQIIGQLFPPSPMTYGCGACYSIVNASASAFQVSLDGTNPLTLTNNGGTGTANVVKWPIQSDWLVIKSSSANLPPDGVRLDTTAYGSQLLNFQMQGVIGNGFFANPYFSHVYFKDVEFSGTTQAIANETDPPTYATFIGWSNSVTGAAALNNLVYDQVWENYPAPPDRAKFCGNFSGNNFAFINSVASNCGLWKAMIQPWIQPTVGTNTLQYYAHTYTYAAAGNTKAACTLATTPTLTIGGSSVVGTAMTAYWTVPGCVLSAQIKTGMTGSGAGWTVSTVASPGYPVDGNGFLNVLKLGTGTWNGTTFNFTIDNDTPAMTTQVSTPYPVPTEGNLGFQYEGGTGPFNITNNDLHSGEAIVGPYADEQFHDACGNGAGGPLCRSPYNAINLTVQRNDIGYDPHYIKDNVLWNGSWWFGRNGPELKQGRYSLWDGNKIGPTYAGVAGGECNDFFSFTAYDPTMVIAPNVQNGSDITYTNNTCSGGNEGIAIRADANLPGYYLPNNVQRVLIHNNLFFTNAFTHNFTGAISGATQFGTTITVGSIEGVTITHNTARWQAGQIAGFLWQVCQLSGGWNYSNNLMDYFTQSGSSVLGFYYSNPSCSTIAPYPFPNGFQLGALISGSYLNSFTANNNGILGTYSDSTPASLVDLSTAAVTTASGNYPANWTWPNAGSTLANRISQVAWYNSGSYTVPGGGNYRLKSTSPLISGAHTSSDGLDIGADINALDRAQGAVANARAYSIGTTTSTVGWTYYGAGYLNGSDTCPAVDYELTSTYVSDGSIFVPGHYTRATSGIVNTGIVQSIPLTGLTTHTGYTARINCPVSQPVFGWTTH